MARRLPMCCDTWSTDVAELDAPSMTRRRLFVRGSSLRADGTLAVLKVGMHTWRESTEIHGLRFWDGDPTVRRSWPTTIGCDALRALRAGRYCARSEREQDVVIAGLLRCLWRRRQHSILSPLSFGQVLSDETLAHIEQWPDTGLVRKVCASLRSCHAQTHRVRVGDRFGTQARPPGGTQHWLVIDPKPFVGDRHDADAAPFNCSAD